MKIKICASVPREFDKILTVGALEFLARMHGRFSGTRQYLLELRRDRQREFNKGKLPDFSSDSRDIKTGDWKIAPVPADLLDRKVEMTGPASSRSRVIHALNSGANCYMADSEDAEAPTWNNIVRGQVNLYDAIRRQIDFETSKKKYQLNEKTAVLMYRPRGLHLLERHVLIDGEPVSASLFDFCMYFYHNVRALIERGTGAYIYIPKMENEKEAALFWGHLFYCAEEDENVPRGSIKATALIETLPAAFRMEEILFALQEYLTGLNCGRWDYIFSYIKTLWNHYQHVLPDRAELTMDKGFLSSYAKLLVNTCHRRGAHAMGGMSAQLPIKDNPEAHDIAVKKVTADKAREVLSGHDGAWCAHPAFVSVVREPFDLAFEGRQNQVHNIPNYVVSREDLLRPIDGDITYEGLAANIEIAVQYLDSWLNGNGAVAINNLMEDAATAEISRSQVWQWLRHDKFTMREFRAAMSGVPDSAAKRIFYEISASKTFAEFLTIPAYRELRELERKESK